MYRSDTVVAKQTILENETLLRSKYIDILK